jgi:hypothetical protein
MTALKTSDRPSGRPVTPTQAPTRKTWVKKTPVTIVLEQIEKQRTKVTEMEKELTKEKRELQKLEQAQKVLEAN